MFRRAIRAHIQRGVHAHRQGQVLRRRKASASSPPMTARTCSCTPPPARRDPRAEGRHATGVRRRRRQARSAGPLRARGRGSRHMAKRSRKPADDMAIIVEDLVKLLDGNRGDLRRGRYPTSGAHAKNRRGPCARSPMTSKPEPVADERLLHAHDLALAALHEITPAETVGPAAGHVVEADDVVALRSTRVSPAIPGVLDGHRRAGRGLGADRARGRTPAGRRRVAGSRLGAVGPASGRIPAAQLRQPPRATSPTTSWRTTSTTKTSTMTTPTTRPMTIDDDDEPKARLHAGDLDGVDIDELDESAGSSDDEDDDSDDSEDDDERHRRRG